MHGTGTCELRFRNGLFFRPATPFGKYIHHHGERIDDVIEGGSCAERILNRQHFVPKARLRLFQCSIVVGLVIVQMIDDEYARRLKFFDIFPNELSTYFHTAFGVEHHDGRVAHFQRRDNFTYKIIKARRVDDVDLAVLPIGVHQCAENRVAAILFQYGKIRSCITLTYTTPTRRLLRFVQHTLRKSRFSRAGVA